MPNNQQDCVVDKAAGDNSTVEIMLTNTGETEPLTWYGVVLATTTVGSIARLVVYNNDCFKALNWWIHVVSSAELTVKSSSVA